MTPAVPSPRLPVTVALTRTFKTGLALLPLVLGLVLAAVSPFAHEWMTPRGPKRLRKSGKSSSDG